jgi:hypothetical protein
MLLYTCPYLMYRSVRVPFVFFQGAGDETF